MSARKSKSGTTTGNTGGSHNYDQNADANGTVGPKNVANVTQCDDSFILAVVTRNLLPLIKCYLLRI